MAAGAEIADLYVLLSGVNAPLLASFAESAAAGEAMVAKIRASMAELDATMAAGAGGAGAEAGLAASVAATTTAEEELAAKTAATMAEVEAAVAGGDKAFADMAAAAKASAVEVEASMSAMSAKMAEDQAAMEAAAVKAEAATTEVGTAAATAGGISSKMLIGAGVAAVGAGVEFAKMAGDFNMATTRLVTSAGETQSNLQMVRDGILGMAGSVGYSSDELAAAMYKVESGGQHGAAALKVLQAAAEGAKAENADLTTVSDALTSAMVDYKVPADQAATVTSKLVAATSQGKMTFEELASSMSAILPVASANHVSLDDILGDLASMTVHGMSAQQATQNLADAIRHMAAPTQVQSKELAVLGMNATEVSKSLGEKGLSGTINDISSRITSQMGPDGMVVVNLTNALKGMAPPVQDLGKKVLDGSMSFKDFTAAAKQMGVINDKNVSSFAALAGSMHGIGTEAKSGAEVYQTYSGALKAAMGDATGMNVALMIGGENAKTTAADIGVVSGATADAAGHVKGFAEIQQEFNFKLAAAKDGLGALAISIGEKLLPVLTPLVGALATGANWLAKHQEAATLLAIAIGGVLVVGLVAATIATWSWFAALVATNLALIGIELPIWAVIAVVVALGYVVYEVIQHWQGIADFFKGVWHAIQAVFEGAKDAVMAPIHAIAKAWDAIMGGFENPAAKFADTVKGFDKFFIEVGQIVKKGWDAVVRFFTEGPRQMALDIAFGLGRIIRTVVDFVEALPRRFGELEHMLVQTGKNMLVGMAHGAEDGAKAVWDFMVALPGRTVTFVANAGTWLVQKGKDVLVGMGHGIEDGAKAVWDFFIALPGHVIDFFAAAPGWLLDAGKNILVGLWNGFTGFIGDVLSGVGHFIMDFIHAFMSGFAMGSPSQIMHDMGVNIITGLLNGITQMWGTLWGWVTQIPGWVMGFFSNSGTWLVNAGYNICVGIYNGIVSGWSMLTNMVSNLAHSLISAAKGALGISSPSKVAADEIGAWFGPGLAQGIAANGDKAVAAAAKLARDVTAAAQGGAVGGLSLTAGGGSGGVFNPTSAGVDGSGVHIHLNVAGSVWTTGDLVKEVQTAMLRHGIRNNNPGINYTYA
jgi:hypothetical protein